MNNSTNLTNSTTFGNITSEYGINMNSVLGNALGYATIFVGGKLITKAFDTGPGRWVYNKIVVPAERFFCRKKNNTHVRFEDMKARYKQTMQDTYDTCDFMINKYFDNTQKIQGITAAQAIQRMLVKECGLSQKDDGVVRDIKEAKKIIKIVFQKADFKAITGEEKLSYDDFKDIEKSFHEWKQNKVTQEYILMSATNINGDVVNNVKKTTIQENILKREEDPINVNHINLNNLHSDNRLSLNVRSGNEIQLPKNRLGKYTINDNNGDYVLESEKRNICNSYQK